MRSKPSQSVQYKDIYYRSYEGFDRIILESNLDKDSLRSSDVFDIDSIITINRYLLPDYKAEQQNYFKKN